MGTWTHGDGQWFGNEAEAKGIITTDDLKVCVASLYMFRDLKEGMPAFHWRS